MRKLRTDKSQAVQKREFQNKPTFCVQRCAVVVIQSLFLERTNDFKPP